MAIMIGKRKMKPTDMIIITIMVIGSIWMVFIYLGPPPIEPPPRTKFPKSLIFLLTE